MTSHGRYPFPTVPDGWFALGRSDEFPPGGAAALRALGRELRVARDASGSPAVRDGAGVALPAGDVDGLLFAWHHARGAPPSWSPPARLGVGWSPITTGGWRARHHVQEVAENTVDSTHAVFVHGFLRPTGISEFREQGHVWTLRWDLELARSYQPDPDQIDVLDPGAVIALAGGPQGRPGEEPVRTTLEIVLSGLGIIDTINTLPGLGWPHLVRFCLTPLTGEEIRYLVAVSVRAPEGTDPAVVAALDRRSLAVAIRDSRQDSYIFDRKRYLDRPVLTRADGPLMRVRKWARQFYSAGSQG